MIRYDNLIKLAETEYAKNQGQVKISPWWNVFQTCGIWMKDRLSALNPNLALTPSTYNFTVLGVLKYVVCLIPALGAAMVFWYYAPVLMPLAILVFYLVEVHLVFLMPLALSGKSNILQKGVVMVYNFGYVRALFLTMGIAFYMISGLVNLKNPLLKWHIGCLAVLIWYQHEI